MMLLFSDFTTLPSVPSQAMRAIRPFSIAIRTLFFVILEAARQGLFTLPCSIGHFSEPVHPFLKTKTRTRSSPQFYPTLRLAPVILDPRGVNIPKPPYFFVRYCTIICEISKILFDPIAADLLNFFFPSISDPSRLRCLSPLLPWSNAILGLPSSSVCGSLFLRVQRGNHLEVPPPPIFFVLTAASPPVPGPIFPFPSF